jgi:hypothetical protein
MGYWGQHLLRSDPDLDITVALEERTVLKLYFPDPEEKSKAREELNNGQFDDLFNAIIAEKKKGTLVNFTAIAMQMGANVNNN